jgi:predicted methyltransferase
MDSFMKRNTALVLTPILLSILSILSSSSAWSASVEEAMGKPGRLASDLERDLRSKPEAIIPLLTLQAGDSVVDIFGSGGYYSELLAGVVEDSGTVLLHNNRGFKAWGINILNDRFEGRDAGNITQHDRELADMDLGENALDAAIIVMAFHDMYVVPTRYNGERYVPVGPPADVGHLLEQIYTGLKPGGRFVVVDHAGDPDMNHADVLELHRMDEQFAKMEIQQRGFRFVSSSDALRNPNDDRSMIVFDLDVQGKTDRFVLVFEKPAI